MLQQFSCNYDKSGRGAKMTRVVQIGKGDEGKLLAAVASTGPVSVAVDGTSNAFRVSNALWDCLSVIASYAHKFCNAHSSTAVEFMTHHDAPAVASIMPWLSLAMASTVAKITGSSRTGTWRPCVNSTS